MPNAVVMLVGTHCDQCRDLEEVMEKKKDIDEKVNIMLVNRKMVLKYQKKNLEENTDPFLYMDQVDEIDSLLDYNLKVMTGMIKIYHFKCHTGPVGCYCGCRTFYSFPLPSLQVLDLLTLDCTKTEDIVRFRSHILKCIQSESAFLCSETILPQSYEEVEQAIQNLVTLEQIPQHGKSS